MLYTYKICEFSSPCCSIPAVTADYCGYNHSAHLGRSIYYLQTPTIEINIYIF